ncbi:MAG: hypothetical protein ABI045_03885 [Flavobacteriales bacterium]
MNWPLYKHYLTVINLRFGNNTGRIRSGQRIDKHIGSAWKYLPDGQLIIGQDDMDLSSKKN